MRHESSAAYLKSYCENRELNYSHDFSNSQCRCARLLKMPSAQERARAGGEPMSFSQSWETISVWVAANLPIAVGGGVAVIVLTTLFFMNWKRRGRNADLLAAATTAGTTSTLNEEKALNWAPPEQSYADRREAVRREGTPVRVVLASPTFRNGISEGVVLDRSTGGLRVAMSIAMAPGSLMQIRAINAPDTIGYVTIIVRSCRKNAEFYELGCEFEKTPPWNVLLLFG